MDGEAEPIEMNHTMLNGILLKLDQVYSDTYLEANCTNSCSGIYDEYQMAAQVALATAIIVALGILLALVWNTIKRRTSGASIPARRSVDSVERLVQDRLRNRPPPYSTAEADKPPSYEDIYDDLSIPPVLPALAAHELPDWARPPGTPEEPQPSCSNQRTVCYENQAFDANMDNQDQDSVSHVQSISHGVDRNAPEFGDAQTEIMVHL